MRKADKKHAKRDQKSGLTGPTDAQLSRALEALNAGAKLSAARQIAGVASSTWCDWMAKGKDPANEKHYAFRQAILEKQAKVQEHLVGIITDSAVNDWKAAAWLLEKLYPKAFGKRALIPVVVKSEVDLNGTDQEQLLESISAALSTRTKQ